jgi:hypothetical protein
VTEQTALDAETRGRAPRFPRAGQSKPASSAPSEVATERAAREDWHRAGAD